MNLAMPIPKGFVYFVATLDGAFIKIGYTTSVDNRMKAIQYDALRDFGCGIRVIGLFPGSFATEQWFQLQISEWRYYTDWFQFSPEVRAFVDSIPLLPPDHRPAHSLSKGLRRLLSGAAAKDRHIF